MLEIIFKISPANKIVTTVMDNAIGDIQITEVLKHKYKFLYNSVPTSDAEMQSSKSDGNYGFKSDYLINGGKRLHILLSMLFKSMLIHGYNANDLGSSFIISIPKIYVLL